MNVVENHSHDHLDSIEPPRIQTALLLSTQTKVVFFAPFPFHAKTLFSLILFLARQFSSLGGDLSPTWCTNERLEERYQALPNMAYKSSPCMHCHTRSPWNRSPVFLEADKNSISKYSFRMKNQVKRSSTISDIEIEKEKWFSPFLYTKILLLQNSTILIRITKKYKFRSLKDG